MFAPRAIRMAKPSLSPQIEPSAAHRLPRRDDAACFGNGWPITNCLIDPSHHHVHCISRLQGPPDYVILFWEAREQSAEQEKILQVCRHKAQAITCSRNRQNKFCIFMHLYPCLATLLCSAKPPQLASHANAKSKAVKRDPYLAPSSRNATK